MPGQAQPDAMPLLRFRLDAVVCVEPAGLGPSSVITAGNTFTLRTELGFDGLFVGLLAGQQFVVRHHVQRIEDGLVKTLPLAGGQFTVPGTGAAHIPVIAGPYTTGPNGSGADLEIPPPPQAGGTYRVTTHVHALNVAVRPIVAAFHDGPIVMVT